MNLVGLHVGTDDGVNCFFTVEALGHRGGLHSASHQNGKSDCRQSAALADLGKRVGNRKRHQETPCLFEPGGLEQWLVGALVPCKCGKSITAAQVITRSTGRRRLCTRSALGKSLVSVFSLPFGRCFHLSRSRCVITSRDTSR